MADLTDLRRELEQKGRITARRLRFDWEDTLRSRVPVATGNMRNRIRVEDRPSGGGFSVTATVDTEYAEYVSSGTRPHIIKPRNASALSFFWPKAGKTVVFAHVNHPGTKPNDFWTRTLGDIPNRVQAIWDSL